jgi:hypothetical protein
MVERNRVEGLAGGERCRQPPAQPSARFELRFVCWYTSLVPIIPDPARPDPCGDARLASAMN